jgi:hypothetical protein
MKLAFATLLMAASAMAKSHPFAPKSKNTAKATYVNKLVRGAKTTKNSQLGRKLNDEEMVVDISSYSIRFEKCQFIKTYDDELADDEEFGSVLATKRFVIFRLCPSGSCSSCNYGYGEYMIDLEQYLETTTQYQQELQEEMCQACEECGNEEEGERRRLVDVDCDTCYDECQKIENMEENGYIDAIDFLECQMIYDPEDDGGDALYAGPICASNGQKVNIGVFTDENCYNYDNSKDVEDYLVDGDGYSMRLSHALLKNTYDAEQCLSCLVVEEEDENANDDEDEEEEEKEPEVTEVCQQLYEEAGKCEQAHGFEGISYYNDAMYENQVATEDVVCNYIKSINNGQYTEDGEIKVKGGYVSSGSDASTTGGQKFALTFFIIGTVGLAIYAATLHAKLTKGSSASLSENSAGVSA